MMSEMTLKVVIMQGIPHNIYMLALRCLGIKDIFKCM